MVLKKNKMMVTELINRIGKGLLMVCMLVYASMAWAQDDPADPEEIQVVDAAALKDAIAGTVKKVIVTGNITLTETLVIDRDVTLNLENHSITAQDVCAIWVKGGDVKITSAAAATISAIGGIATNSSVIRIGDDEGEDRVTKLTIDDKITIASDKCHGIFVSGGKTKETLVVNGSISITDAEACAIIGNGNAGNEDTDIIVGANAIVSSTGDVAIYQPQSGKLTINGQVSGKGGIEIKAGELVVNDGAKVSVLEGFIPIHKENPEGVSTYGFAIAIVENNSYAGVSKVTVSPSATLVGAVASVQDSASENPAPTLDGLSMDVEIAGIKYTQASAFQVVPEGGTIKLLANIETNNPLVISKPLTLDLDGRTITAGVSLAEGSPVISLESAGSVVVKNGTIATSAGNGISGISGNATLQHVNVNASGTAIDWVSTGNLIVDGTLTGQNGIVMKAGELSVGSTAVITASETGYAIEIVKHKDYAGVKVVDVDASATLTGLVAEVIETSNTQGATEYKGSIQMVAQAGDKKFSALAPALATESETVSLLSDVTISSALAITSAKTLDLAGHTITAVGLTDKNYVLKVLNCNAILKNGKIMNDQGRGIYCELGKTELQDLTVQTAGYALLVSDAATVNVAQTATLTSTDNYAVVVWGDTDKNPKLDVYGKIYSTSSALDGYAAISGNGTDPSHPIVTIHPGAVVSSAQSTAIYWPNGGDLIINGGEITGYTGIYAKCGTVTITGGTITGNGAKTDYTYSGGGYHSTGDAIVIDNCNYPMSSCSPSISGGVFISENAEAVASYANADNTPVGNFVSGGSFSSQLKQEVCAEGYITSPLLNEKGMYGVAEGLEINDASVWVAPSVDFQVKQATYTRVTGMGVTKYGTLCLPFSIKPSSVNGIKFYTVSGISNKTLTIAEVSSEIAAGTPVIFELSTAASTMSITTENAQVTSAAAKTEANLVGSFSELEITSGLSDIYYLNGDAFHQADMKVTVPAFRAYIQLSSPSGAPTRAKSLAIETVDATGVDAVLCDEDFDSVYDLQGHRQDGLKQGVNVMKTKDGRTIKVFVNKK